MLEIAKEFVEMSTYVEERPGSDDNICDDIEVVQSVKTRCYEETKAAMRELTRVRSRAIRLECTLKAQRAEGLMNGLDNYRYLTAKEDRRDEEGSSRRDRVRGSHTWTEEERIIAFHCLLRYGKDFEAVAEVLGTKTSDKVKSFYSDMKDDIDKLLEKEAEKEAKLVKEFDLEQEVSVEAPKNVEIVNLD
ncbi:Myb-like DNA-binding domain protein [Teladorsagia circumcincta]|uniref:Myb-like DNA-binding domain protein n=1 Tax=Teladorsagia circumcincta TaxID=45464 RepID=A0A2G9V4L1_TELCI|nr:Myb-like DNA-binding domain protein [Teladorsagia circumcincta]